MISGNPLVSIIMPTYNRAQYILETIRSIQKQDYANWELLVMDDGSEDNTEAIVTTIQDSRIQYYNDGRKGITGILKNKGIRLSKGELIAFMDSDDLWPSHKLSAQLAALQQYPEAAFSFTNGHNFNENGITDIYYKQKEGIEIGNFFDSLCKGEKGVFIQTVMMWKKYLGIDTMFRENRIFTDFSFITNIAYKYKAVVLYEQLFSRRLHDTNNVSFNWAYDYDEHIETILRYYNEKKLTKRSANKILFKTHMHYGLEYNERAMKMSACKQYLKGWRYNPLSVIPLKKILLTL